MLTAMLFLCAYDEWVDHRPESHLHDAAKAFILREATQRKLLTANGSEDDDTEESHEESEPSAA